MFIFLISRLCLSLSVDSILGVSPLNAGRYRRSISERKQTFSCFDGSKIIPLSRLNDGYCDCSDGSDEPGTNACSFFSADGGFYCRNSGSQPKIIPRWMVGDGVCDCCDGSDEANNTWAHCEDVCGSVRKKSEEFRRNFSAVFENGTRLRVKYSERGRMELTLRRKQLQTAESLKNKVFRASSLVEQIYWEMKGHGEAADMIEQLNLSVSEIKNEFKNIEKTEKNVRKGSRKVKDEVPHYGRFNLKKRTELYFNVETCIVWLPDFGNTFFRLHNAYKIVKEFLKSYLANRIPDHPTASFNKLSAITSKIDNSTIKVKSMMDIDFGPDKEFLPLYKQWYYYEKDDWFIEFYPYQNCTKHSKKDFGYKMDLGFYNQTEQLRWIFTDGDSCGFHTPRSSVDVLLHCRLKDEILSFEEITKCHFKLDFGTPTACIDEYKRRIDLMDDITLDEFAKSSGLY